MRPFPRDQSLGPWYRSAAVILWPAMMAITRREWRGAENLGEPGDGRVIAVNHLSWFDPIVISHFLNDNDRAPRFMGKDKLFELPVLGQVMRGAGQIPVYRNSADASDAVRAAVAAVEAGETVVVYPEGTLTRDPDLWPMRCKTGAARIGLLSGKPVIPVAHWGAQDVMRPYEKEFNAFPPKLMQVTAGPPVYLDDLVGLPLTEDVLVEATGRIGDAITAVLATLRKESPPSGRWNPRTGRRENVRHPLPLDRREERQMATTKKAPAKKTAAKKTTAKKAAVRKAPAKKAAAKKAPARKAAVKKTTAKKAPVKKAPAKKAPAKKAAVKKAPAKKAAVKKAPAKKAAVKKAPARKAAVKKAPARKATARGAAVKRTAKRA